MRNPSPQVRGVLHRWGNVLPLTESTPRISLGEGDTPLVRSSALELTRAWRGQLTASLLAHSHFGGDEGRCEAAAAMAIGLFQMVWAGPTAKPADLRQAFNEAQSVTQT